MDAIQTVNIHDKDLLTRILSTCLDKSVHDTNEIADDISLGRKTLAVSPSGGFWIFSKDRGTLKIDACQGIGLCRHSMLKFIEGIARRNACNKLWFQTRLKTLVLLGERLGFSCHGKINGFYQLRKPVQNVNVKQ